MTTSSDAAGTAADATGTAPGPAGPAASASPGLRAAGGASASANSPAGPGSPAEAGRIAVDLRVALSPLVRRLRQVKPDGELTFSQISAMVRLDREGPATATELAAGEGIRPQSMCTIIGVLQERGLVVRDPDPSDGRRIVVSLSQAGLDGLHGARAERARRLARAIDEELTPEEQRLLADAIPLLERITRRV
ncbi:MarR family winged helix-turn-helix transcriptional regulator [Streptomyces sp. NPDC087422]|uniref:MarR family winged helix-turn-helix transcriptional regulator n=1 Tax=Streptomyces sp. NPDC087422 TaxID=3365786 RepID=UPI00381B6862